MLKERVCCVFGRGQQKRPSYRRDPNQRAGKKRKKTTGKGHLEECERDREVALQQRPRVDPARAREGDSIQRLSRDVIARDARHGDARGRLRTRAATRARANSPL